MAYHSEKNEYLQNISEEEKNAIVYDEKLQMLKKLKDAVNKSDLNLKQKIKNVQ